MPQRFAIYYAPDTTSGLWDRASVWLGRDAANGSLIDGAVAGIDRVRLLNRTQSAGRYGFHATLKPPMALAEGRTAEALKAELAAFAAGAAPVSLGKLQIASLAGFMALTPVEGGQPVQDLAADIVSHFEPFRAPLQPRDRAGRLAAGLNPRQQELLDTYGYPYVMDEFRFHMTLTDRLDGDDASELAEAALAWFAPTLAEPVVLDRLVLFVEPERGHPFRRVADFTLGG